MHTGKPSRLMELQSSSGTRRASCSPAMHAEKAAGGAQLRNRWGRLMFIHLQSPHLTHGYPAAFRQLTSLGSGHVALKRMDNVGIVVEDLDTTIAFFRELGLNLEGRAMIEGAWAGRVTGLGDQRVEIAMMRTPDGHSRLELSRFPHSAGRRRSPEHPGQRSRLPPRHVRRGRHR